MRLVVRDGKPARHLRGIDTIPEAFATIDRAFGEADRVQVRYDPVTGVPRRIFVDSILNAIDDEVTYLIALDP